MRIFRVEHPKTKLGPWGHFGSINEGVRKSFSRMWRGSHRGRVFLVPEHDGIEGGIRKEERSGFYSLDDVLYWFRSFKLWKLLSRSGFYVAEYEVPDEYVRRGGSQAVFLPTEATMVEVHALPMLNDWRLELTKVNDRIV